MKKQQWYTFHTRQELDAYLTNICPPVDREGLSRALSGVTFPMKMVVEIDDHRDDQGQELPDYNSGPGIRFN